MSDITQNARAGRIGLVMSVALVMGNMVGSGIFLLPASLARFGGLSLVGWLVSSVGALLLAGVFAHLARLDPAAGGPYAYTRRAFGDMAGFVVAWGYWISIWASLGAIAVAFVGYLAPFAPALVENPAAAAATAIAAVWILIGVNVAGVRRAGWTQSVTTVLKVLPLAGVAVVGLLRFEPAHFQIPPGDARVVASSVASAVTLTLWAFLGLESATVPSGSIERPGRTIPRATMIGTALTSLLYVSSTVGVMSLLPPAGLRESTAPFADAARTVGGSTAAAAVALGAAVSCFGALNGWVLLVGQLPLAVARDGLFPSMFGRLSVRGTPATGMLVAGGLTSALVATNYTRGLVDLFTFISLLSTLNTLIPYVFSSLALFLIAPAEHSGLRAGVGLMAALAFAYSVWAVAGAGPEIVYWGFLLLLSGLPVYVTMRRSARQRARRAPEDGGGP